jgi:hypothetical protein
MGTIGGPSLTSEKQNTGVSNEGNIGQNSEKSTPSPGIPMATLLWKNSAKESGIGHENSRTVKIDAPSSRSLLLL